MTQMTHVLLGATITTDAVGARLQTLAWQNYFDRLFSVRAHLEALAA